MVQRSLVIGSTLLLAVTITSCNKAADAPAAPAASTAANTSSSPADSAPAASSGPVSQADRDGIAKAIQQHLAENKGINMAAMDMNVQNVTTTGDQAQADTVFRLKQGGTSMQMTYSLERHGGGWIVTKNQPSGAGQFAHPPMDQIHSGTESPRAVPSSSPAVPDVSEFLKNPPPTKSN